jgi:hypothetical protein
MLETSCRKSHNPSDLHLLSSELVVSGSTAGAPYLASEMWVLQMKPMPMQNSQVYPPPMEITLTIPEELAAQIIPAGKDPARAALEALAIDGYRTRNLTESQVRRMLGFETRMQVHALLKEHDVYLNFAPDHAQQELDAANQMRAERLASATSAR